MLAPFHLFFALLLPLFLTQATPAPTSDIPTAINLETYTTLRDGFQLARASIATSGFSPRSPIYMLYSYEQNSAHARFLLVQVPLSERTPFAATTLQLPAYWYGHLEQAQITQELLLLRKEGTIEEVEREAMPGLRPEGWLLQVSVWIDLLGAVELEDGAVAGAVYRQVMGRLSRQKGWFPL